MHRFGVFGFSGALLVAAAFAAPASAVCDISLTNVSRIQFAGTYAYDVFNAVETSQVVPFSVRHKKSDACSYFVTFSTGGAGTYNRRLAASGLYLPYQLTTFPGGTVLKAMPVVSAGEVIAGTFTTVAETQAKSYLATIPALNVVVPNYYSDVVVIRLYEGTLANYVERDSASIQVSANVARRVELCVGCTNVFDPGAFSHTLNFGTLEKAEFLSGTVRVRSNSGYQVTLSSANRGLLRNTTLFTTVPYTFTVDGATVSLANKNVLLPPVAGVTPVQGRSHEFGVRIGDVTDADPGDYEDDITITVRAL